MFFLFNMTSIAIEQRKKDLELLAKHEFDILIVGAGITGAGIAWDAAMRGLKVMGSNRRFPALVRKTMALNPGMARCSRATLVYKT